ncbi:MAG: prepilin peptidase [Rubritepida sp.]|nr:prepilin peptidase [Rubritepida sp.]
MTAAFLATGISALLLLAAWHDVATRLIPDSISIAIAVLAVLWRASLGGHALLTSAATAILVFAALLVLCMRGFLGGADVKLAAAVALALPPAMVPDFVLATTLLGGLLGLAYAAKPQLGPHGPVGTNLLRRVFVAEARRLRRGGPLPYCVAIAGGGILTLISGSGS